jgi:hypothetical protein
MAILDARKMMFDINSIAPFRRQHEIGVQLSKDVFFLLYTLLRLIGMQHRGIDTKTRSGGEVMFV